MQEQIIRKMKSQAIIQVGITNVKSHLNNASYSIRLREEQNIIERQTLFNRVNYFYEQRNRI